MGERLGGKTWGFKNVNRALSSEEVISLETSLKSTNHALTHQQIEDFIKEIRKNVR